LILFFQTEICRLTAQGILSLQSAMQLMGS
jgi:hypothetical protein